MRLKWKKRLALIIAFVMACSCLANIPSKAEETAASEGKTYAWDFEDVTQADDFDFTSTTETNAFSVAGGVLTTNSTTGSYMKAITKESYNVGRVSVDISPVQTTDPLDAHILLGITGEAATKSNQNDMIGIRWWDADTEANGMHLKVYQVTNNSEPNNILDKWVPYDGALYTGNDAQPVHMDIDVVGTKLIITITLLSTLSNNAPTYRQYVADITVDAVTDDDKPVAPALGGNRLQGRVGFAVDGQTAKFDNFTVEEQYSSSDGVHTWDFSNENQVDDFKLINNGSAELMSIQSGSLNAAAPNNNSGYSKAVLESNCDLKSVSVDICKGATDYLDGWLALGVKGQVGFEKRAQGGCIYIQLIDTDSTHNQIGCRVYYSGLENTLTKLYDFWISSNNLYTSLTPGNINIKVGIDGTKLDITLSSLDDKSLYITKTADIAYMSDGTASGLTEDVLLGRVGVVNNGWCENGTSTTVRTSSFDNLTIIEKDAPETWDFTYGAQAEDFGFKTDNTTNGSLSIDKETEYLTSGTTTGYKHAFLNETYENVKSFSVDVYPLAIEKTVVEETITVKNVRADVFFGLQGENFVGSNYAHTIRLVWADYWEDNNWKQLSLMYYNENKNDKTELANWDSLITSAGLYTGNDAQPVNITVNLKGTVIEVTVTSLDGSDNPVSYTNKVDIAEKNLTSDILEGRIGLGSMSWIDAVDNQTARAQFDNLKIMTYDSQMEKEDYSVVVIPDQQVLSRYKPDKLNGLYQWIADNAETENIKYVLNLGDLADSGVKEEVLKANMEASKNAYDIIAAKNIPMALVPGNHDYNENTGYRNTEVLNSYFNTTNGYGTNENITYMTEGEVENSYHTFTANEGTMFEQKYLIVALEYGARDSVIAWADKVIQEHADYQVIVMTHGYLNYDGTLLNSATRHAASHSSYLKTEGEEAPNDADALWTKLISKHGNIIMVLSGHIGTDDVVVRTDKGVNGNDVVQMLVDGQHRDAENECQGVGLLGLMRFDGTSGEMTFKYFSPLQGEDGNTMKYLGTSNQFDLTLPVQDGRLVVNGLATRTVLNIKDQANLPTGYVDDKFIINWTLNGEEVDVFDESQNGYTPNFADPEMLDVCYQTNEAIAQAGTDKYNIRFISSLNAYEDYEEAGFLFMSDTKYTKDAVIEINADNTAKVSTKKLYTSLLASGNTVSAVDYYGNDYQQYFFTFEMTGIPAEKALYVRSYVKLNSGEILYGDVKCITAPAVKAQ